MTVADRWSLAPAAARKLAKTTKSVPQTSQDSPRWLLRMLPWVTVKGATYRLNRRLSYRVGDGRVAFVTTGARIEVIPEQLRELPPLRGLDDPAALRALAGRFTTHEFAPGEILAAQGEPVDRVLLIARGLARRRAAGEYGADTVHGVLGHGDHVGHQLFGDPQARWPATVEATTAGTLLALPRQAVADLRHACEPLREHLARPPVPPRALNRYGEAAIALSAGHSGEPDLPGTFVDYEATPRELALSVAQTVLRVHTRVADLYNDPMDQVEQQQRLTVVALREQQEYELVNNPEFGLLYNADLRQRCYPRAGPPTPDDLDQLLARRRRSHFFLAHPRTIAAFGRECTRRGIYPRPVEVAGHRMPAWRGVPLLPCDKIPVTRAGTSSVLVLRTGEQHEGVVGLRPARLPDEREPGLSVRAAGVDSRGLARFLVSAYYSVAVLVPDALGVLEHVDIREKP